MEKAEVGESQGKWWSWGAGTHGQLGTGAFQDELLPRALPPPSVSPLLQIACGGSHSVAVLGNGEAMTWGNNSSGQLGHGNSQSSCEPILVKELQSLKIRSVSAGWSHTAFISDDHTLFTCGNGGYGQLGHGNLDSISIPKRVMYFASMKISLAACGPRHTLILAGSGENVSVYAFGSSKKGQLGIESIVEVVPVTELSNSINIYYPAKIGSLVGCKISSIYANGDHSAVLNDHGELYVWGKAFGTRANILVPSKVKCRSSFSQVAIGWNHLLALTYDGQVYATGSQKAFGALNASGAVTSKDNVPQSATILNKNKSICALSDEASEVSVDVFQPLKGFSVTWIATGAEHSAAVLSDGSIVTWGWGEHGQLGLGSTADQSFPKAVIGIPRMLGARICCGSGFSFLYDLSM